MSLLTFFSKVLKRAMHCRLSQHLHINNLLVTEQYSFRKGILTEDAAYRLIDFFFLLVLQPIVGLYFAAL